MYEYLIYDVKNTIQSFHDCRGSAKNVNHLVVEH